MNRRKRREFFIYISCKRMGMIIQFELFDLNNLICIIQSQ